MDKVGLVIPTLNAGKDFEELSLSIKQQSLALEHCLIIDSGSTDYTAAIAKKYGMQVISIRAEDFNHGGTRQRAFELLQESVDIIIFITQDVILHDTDSFKKLVETFQNRTIGAAYGRQLPHIGSSPMAAQLRLFNYPAHNVVKSYQDRNKIGIKAAFLSDSFAAYRSKCLKEIGGFPKNVIVAEDMYVGARILLAGYKIAYVSEAKVYHSHNYTLLQDVRRYFDTGVFQSREKWIKENFGSVEGEGVKLILFQAKYMYQHSEYLGISKMLMRNLLRFVAYKLGKLERYLPVCISKVCSAQRWFWK